MPKINRNDPCKCGSGKKYKVCCLQSDYEEKNKYLFGQHTHTEKVADVISRLQQALANSPDTKQKKFIDITLDLRESNYRNYQIKNYTNDIVMIAEKTLESEDVFLTRVDSSQNDIILMYKGSYRTFQYSMFSLLINNLVNYIK